MAVEFQLGIKVNKVDAKEASRQLKKFRDELKRAENQIFKFSKSSKAASRGLGGFSKTAKISSLSFGALVIAVKKSVSDFAKLEASITAVARIAGLSSSEIEGLTNTIQQLSTETGVSTDSIIKFAETGARFGLRGDDLEDFTDAMSRFGAITGNVTEASQQNIAKLKEITDDTGVSFSRLANSVVSLGQKFPTTESKIIKTANRIAQDLSAFNITTEFALGLGTAIEATGLGAERASTAIGQLTRSLLKLQRSRVGEGASNFKALAESAGFTAENFREIIVADPAQALIDLLKNANSSELALRFLNETGTRTAGSFATLNNNAKLVAEAFSAASEGIKNADTLLEQQQQQLDTLSGQWSKFYNTITVVSQNIGKAVADGLDLEDALADVTQGLRLIEGLDRIAPQVKEELDKISASGFGPPISLEDQKTAAKEAAKAKRIEEELRINRESYNKAVRDTAEFIKQINEASRQADIFRGLTGGEATLAKIQEDFRQRSIEIGQRFASEIEKALAAKRTEEELEEIRKKWAEASQTIGEQYRKDLAQAQSDIVSDLEKRLERLNSRYQDIRKREEDQRREFGRIDQDNEALTSKLDIAEFEASLVGVERERQEEKRQRIQEHKENREDAKAIKEEAAGIRKEIKKLKPPVKGAAQT